jgi:hypothetical protein
MKSLDVVVLCRIFMLQGEAKARWIYASLAEDVCMSIGETPCVGQAA